MPHTIEPASSGRAKCRGCDKPIAKGILRFGERLPNPFSEGKEMTHWFHLRCAAMKRPDVLLATLDDDKTRDQHVIENEPDLRRLASAGLEHRRVPRINGAELSPSGRARCRHCREMIEKGAWRVGLVFYDEGQFNPSGYIHLGCCSEYLETIDIVDRIAHFSPDLSDAELSTIGEELAASDGNGRGAG